MASIIACIVGMVVGLSVFRALWGPELTRLRRELEIAERWRARSDTERDHYLDEWKALQRRHAVLLADREGLARVVAEVRARELLSEMEIARVMTEQEEPGL